MLIVLCITFIHLTHYLENEFYLKLNINTTKVFLVSQYVLILSMSLRFIDKTKTKTLKKIQSLVKKKSIIKKINIIPTDIVKNTKGKITNFYDTYKKEKEKEKIRLEKKRKSDQKKELILQKKQIQKEK